MDKNKTKIILDTNFLLIPFQFNVDIFTEIKEKVQNSKIYILDKTIDELENIREKDKKASNRNSAKMSITLLNKKIKEKNINIIKTPKEIRVDDYLLELSKRYIIATQDKELKKRIKQNKGKLLILRQKKYISTENVL